MAAAKTYAEAGTRCAIDTFLLPEHRVFWSGLAQLRIGLVVLRPHVEIAVARNAARLEQTGWGVPTWQVLSELRRDELTGTGRKTTHP